MYEYIHIYMSVCEFAELVSLIFHSPIPFRSFFMSSLSIYLSIFLSIYLFSPA